MRRKQEPFQRGRTDDIVEKGLIAGLLHAVMTATLFVDVSHGDIGHRINVVVHDRRVLHARTDDTIAELPQAVQHRLKVHFHDADKRTNGKSLSIHIIDNNLS